MFRKILRFIKIGILTGIPILLLILPANYFDQGDSISIFAMLGVEGYYSEGMTRACMHLIHFDFLGARAYNELSFLVVPLLVVIWGSALMRELTLLRRDIKMGNAPANANRSNAQQRFANLPLALLVFAPAIGFAIALNQYFIPETSLSFAISMPITVAIGGLAAVAFNQLKAKAWPRRFAGVSVYAMVILVVLFALHLGFPPVA